MSEDKSNSALREFRKRKVMTLEQIIQLTGRSVPTVRRRLKAWGAISSYNQNGRFYTLPEIAAFDGDGLWHWRKISFSRHGTLKNTVIELVARSQAGLDGREIGSLLGLDPRSFLSPFAADPQLSRHKVQGRYVYYAADPLIFEQQQRRRAGRTDRLPSNIEAVAILVEKIKRPFLDTKSISQQLRKQNVFVEPEVIENLFFHHDLSVKKTAPSVGLDA